MKRFSSTSRTLRPSYYLPMDPIRDAGKLLYCQKDTGFALPRRPASNP